MLARRLPYFVLNVLVRRRHWGLSRWRLVQFTPLRDRAAREQGPGHSTVLTGSSLHSGPPMRREPTNTACTVTSVAPGTTTTCQPGNLRIVSMALLMEQAREVYGRCDRWLHEEPGQEGWARQTAPALCTPAMASDHPQSREHATALPLLPTKTR